ncbi:MAG: GDP-mannose 4,6-dehydratase, partial [Treponema sp.]|nr:GDP-mannose 4,6-dehydratase [Treponema sp.]
MRKLQNVLVTGGAGFIGCNFIHFLLSEKSGFTGRVINVDSLTYAGNLESLSDVEKLYGGTKYFFEKVDICACDEMERVFSEYDVDTVVHFAAESHVDRSILGPESFIKTNVMGTFTLLECAKNYWSKNALMREDVLFHHVSTDEVYGSLGKTGKFSETTPYSPRSPYSASKAASDHLVKQLNVLPLIFAANVVFFATPSFLHYEPNCFVVVFDINPVADVF